MPIDKAVILSAGKGSRLLPLTADRPKCLIALSGRTLLDWQLDALQAAGIADIVVVTGFRDDLVDAVAARRRGVRTLFNPFYHVADNLGSVWMARAEFDRDLLLLNGDTLVPPSLLARVLAAETGPIAVTIDEKADYDSDDMKVLREGDRLLRIGKALEPGAYNAESIGLIAFRGGGPPPVHRAGGADDALARRHPPLVSARDRRSGPGGGRRSAPSRSRARNGRRSTSPRMSRKRRRSPRAGPEAPEPVRQRRDLLAVELDRLARAPAPSASPHPRTVTPQALRSPS